jgi:Tol biopolymer transport system component
VNRIEERLRDAFGAAAATVGPEAIRGLPSEPPSPPRWRPLAPLAAAAAVAAIIAAVFLVMPMVLPGHQGAARQTPGSVRVANGKIVFVRGLVPGGSVNHAQLWTVNPDGSGMAPLTALPGPSAFPAWSPDGKELVFAHAPRFASPPSPPTPLWSLYIMSRNGTGPTGLRRLTRCQPPGCWQDYEPAWSPDGSQIAFVRNQDIYLINADGTGVRRLTRAATPLGDGQPAWSPDGHRLAFTVLRAQPDRLPAIYVMNANGSGAHRLTGCRPGCAGSQPAWSPDGTKIAFAGNQDIYTVTPTGSGVTRLTDCAHIAGCVDAGGPAWSPDGRKIVFWVEGHDSVSQLYLMNANGSDAQPLIPKSSDVCCMAWQPLPATRSTRVTPSPRPSTALTVGRCVHATATGDFDGDGTPDVATLVDVLPVGQTCRQNLAHHLRIRVTFGSGGGFDRPFTYCTGGACDAVFTATDLAGNGRSELAVEVGPGAAIDFVEFFYVGPHGLSPLRIAAAGAAKAGLKPGPAVFGGSFDSGAQSPIACTIRPGGSRVLISTQAQSLSSRITGPWRVQRTELQLRGGSLHGFTVTTARVHGFRIGSLRFHNGCP